MKLTDHQKYILREAADIFEELGCEDIFHDYNNYIDGITLADDIREFVNKPDYLYDHPAGPMTKRDADLEARTKVLRSAFFDALKPGLSALAGIKYKDLIH